MRMITALSGVVVDRTVICVECSVPFRAYRPGSMFCGEKCRRMNYTKKCRQKRGAMNYQRECIVCGKPFETNIPQTTGCSKECRNTRRRELGRAALARHWERQLRDGVENLFSLRFEVFKRDGFRCTYCGRAAKDGISLHADHIIPRIKGGKNTPDNLTTACLECNLGKSDVLLSDHRLRKQVGLARHKND